ncbi:MAG: WD40/YVTN/BNR-like repeat-containing protein [Cephaloticoccus sp.]
MLRRLATACCLLFATALSAAPAPRVLLLGAARSTAGIVAVGERGTLLLSTDEGANWTGLASPSTATLTAVSFAPGGEHGWAVGHDAVILHTADGGRTWQMQWQGDNLEDSWLDVCALADGRVVVVGAYGLALVSADAGQTWSNLVVQDYDSHLNRIVSRADGTLFIAGERGTLLRSPDQGRTWEPIPAPYDGSFYGLLPLQSGALLAYGLRGHVYRSTDDGENWEAVPTDSHALLAAAVETPAGTIWLAGQSRTLLQSTDDGVSFAAASGSLTTAIGCLFSPATGIVLALGEAGVQPLQPAD